MRSSLTREGSRFIRPLFTRDQSIPLHGARERSEDYPCTPEPLDMELELEDTHREQYIIETPVATPSTSWLRPFATVTSAPEYRAGGVTPPFSSSSATTSGDPPASTRPAIVGSVRRRTSRRIYLIGGIATLVVLLSILIASGVVKTSENNATSLAADQSTAPPTVPGSINDMPYTQAPDVKAPTAAPTLSLLPTTSRPTQADSGTQTAVVPHTPKPSPINTIKPSTQHPTTKIITLSPTVIAKTFLPTAVITSSAPTTIAKTARPTQVIRTIRPTHIPTVIPRVAPTIAPTPQATTIANRPIYFGAGIGDMTMAEFMLLDGGVALDAQMVYAAMDPFDWDTLFLNSITPSLEAGYDVILVPEFETAAGDGSQATIINGYFDAAMNALWAKVVELQPVLTRTGRQFWIRPLHEFNGSWNAWGSYRAGNSVQGFIDSYRRIALSAAAAGIIDSKSILFQLAYNCDSEGNDPAPFSTWWPGNDVAVDVVLCSAANRFGADALATEWKSFPDIFRSGYNSMLALASGKPIGIAETGCMSANGYDKALWFTELFDSLQTEFTEVAAVGFNLEDTVQNGGVQLWSLQTLAEYIALSDGISRFRAQRR